MDFEKKKQYLAYMEKKPGCPAFLMPAKFKQLSPDLRMKYYNGCVVTIFPFAGYFLWLFFWSGDKSDDIKYIVGCYVFLVPFIWWVYRWRKFVSRSVFR